MALQLLQLPLVASLSSTSTTTAFLNNQKLPIVTLAPLRKSRNGRTIVLVSDSKQVNGTTTTTSSSIDDPDLEYISQIKRVLELLKKNRDMTFQEVKLTVMIEDPRDVERKRLLGIDDETAPTRDELAAALEEVNEGKIPENSIALQMLADEMVAWPNLEVNIAEQKKKPAKSLYARFTDTGIDPKEAAKRLNIDWDSAAQIEDNADGDDVDVPAAVDDK